ncbi:MAG: sporulation transcription factor Spo0A [Bacilli bacterium]|nr:sporulation transcription factor Spo0A [Bacilli bacterium]
MNEIKLFIIEDNPIQRSIIKEYFQKRSNMKIVREANNGEEGMKWLEEDYDVLLLDIVMPKKDGIEVLKYMRDHQLEKRVIVMTACNSQEFIQKATELGASYYLLKPFDLNKLEEMIKEVILEKTNRRIHLYQNELQASITKVLHELGIPSHMKGYLYLKEGIEKIYENPELAKEITKKLYPMIAKKYHSSTIRVERSIRHAIEVGWNRANWDFTEEVFGYSIDSEKAKPTNREYMTTIAEKIKMDYHKPLLST